MAGLVFLVIAVSDRTDLFFFYLEVLSRRLQENTSHPPCTLFFQKLTYYVGEDIRPRGRPLPHVSFSFLLIVVGRSTAGRDNDKETV